MIIITKIIIIIIIIIIKVNKYNNTTSNNIMNFLFVIRLAENGIVKKLRLCFVILQLSKENMKVVPEAGEAEQSREFSLSCVVTMAKIQIMRRLEERGG